MNPRQSHRPALDVLISEDDVITRMAIRQVLEGEGYRCAEAENGLEALDIARQGPPRLAILDVMMPGMDGFDLARQLRSDQRTRGIRVLFLTGRNDPAAKSAAQRVGGDVLLTKPVDFQALLDVVSVALHCGQDQEKEK